MSLSNSQELPPEIVSALLFGSPHDSASVVFWDSQGAFGVGVLWVSSGASGFWEETLVCLDADGWAWFGSSNAPGWSSTSRGMGVLTAWGPAPGERVVVDFADGVSEVAEVRLGQFFVCRWNVPDADAASLISPAVRSGP